MICSSLVSITRLSGLKSYPKTVFNTRKRYSVIQLRRYLKTKTHRHINVPVSNKPVSGYTKNSSTCYSAYEGMMIVYNDASNYTVVQSIIIIKLVCIVARHFFLTQRRPVKNCHKHQR